jgi:hypothetical protein
MTGEARQQRAPPVVFLRTGGPALETAMDEVDNG